MIGESLSVKLTWCYPSLIPNATTAEVLSSGCNIEWFINSQSQLCTQRAVREIAAYLQHSQTELSSRCEEDSFQVLSLESLLHPNVFISELESCMNEVLEVLADKVWTEPVLRTLLDDVGNMTASPLRELSMRSLTTNVSSLEQHVQRLESNIALTRESIAILMGWLRFHDQQAKERIFQQKISAAALTSGHSIEECESAPQLLCSEHKTHSDLTCDTDYETICGSKSESLNDIHCSSNAVADCVLPVSSFLPPDLLKIVLQSPVYDKAIEELCNDLPTPNVSIHDRRVQYLCDQLKSIRNTAVFDIGLQSSEFSLAEDEVRLLLVGSNSYQPSSNNSPTVSPTNSSSNGHGTTSTTESMEKTVASMMRLLSQASANAAHQSNSSNHSSNSSTSIAATSGKTNNCPAALDLSAPAQVLTFHPQHQKPGRVDGMLDNHVPFVVTFRDDDQEAALLLFFDECDTIIGRNHLFRRSVRLIRAWWIYESVLYVGATIRHYLPNHAFMVMIVAIFNKYDMFISTPLHALCLFLAEYSLFQPNVHSITLRGVTDVEQESPWLARSLLMASTRSKIFDGVEGANELVKNSQLAVDQECDSLFGAQFVDSFKLLLHRPPEMDPQQCLQAQQSFRRDFLFASSRENSKEGLVDVSVLSTDRDSVGSLGNETCTSCDPAPLSRARCLSRDNSTSSVTSSTASLSRENSRSDASKSSVVGGTDHRGLVIVHPLTGENMVHDKLTANQLIRLTKAMQNGAANLSVFLKQIQDKPPGSHSDLIKNFFPNLVALISTTNRTVETGRFPFVLGPDQRSALLGCVHHQRLLFNGVLSFDGLMSLLLSIMKDVPVMRISDLTSAIINSVFPAARDQLLMCGNNSLPQELTNALLRIILHSEKGKELLFVMDDPATRDLFVLLRSAISTAQQSLIARGIISPSALLQFNRQTSSAVDTSQDLSANGTTNLQAPPMRSCAAVNEELSPPPPPNRKMLMQRSVSANASLSSSHITNYQKNAMNTYVLNNANSFRSKQMPPVNSAQVGLSSFTNDSSTPLEVRTNPFGLQLTIPPTAAAGSSHLRSQFQSQQSAQYASASRSNNNFHNNNAAPRSPHNFPTQYPAGFVPSNHNHNHNHNSHSQHQHVAPAANGRPFPLQHSNSGPASFGGHSLKPAAALVQSVQGTSRHSFVSAQSQQQQFPSSSQSLHHLQNHHSAAPSAQHGFLTSNGLPMRGLARQNAQRDMPVNSFAKQSQASAASLAVFDMPPPPPSLSLSLSLNQLVSDEPSRSSLSYSVHSVIDDGDNNKWYSPFR